MAAARPAGRILELGTGVAPGGTCLIDDIDPRPGRPEGHETAVVGLLAALEAREDFRTVRLGWASGLLMAVRTAARGVSRT